MAINLGFAALVAPVHNSASSMAWIQQQALRSLFEATSMDSTMSRKSHDWFDDMHIMDDDDGIYDFCSFEGIECTEVSYVDPQEGQGDATDEEIVVNIVTEINLADKGLVGSIPNAVFETLSFVETLNLASNDITGVYICPLTHLKVLILSDNPGISGSTIPSCMENFSDLKVFKFDRVGLVGTIPPALCSSNRRMNDWNPNEVGCDAIACASGTYEPTRGRQKNKSMHCQPCATLKTGQLGSTVCPEAPSQSPSIQPSSTPSIVPTDVPSLSPSIAPSSPPSLPPSETPTNAQNKMPTYTPTPTLRLTPGATSGVTGVLHYVFHTLYLQVVLGGAHRLLSGPEERQSMEIILLEFLQLQEKNKQGPEAAVVTSLAMTKQTLASSSSGGNTTGTESGMLLVLLPTPTHNVRTHRNLTTVDETNEEYSEVKLHVDFKVVVGTLATWNQSRIGALVTSWNEEIDQFATLMANTESLSTLLDPPIDVDNTEETDPNGIIDSAGQSLPQAQSNSQQSSRTLLGTLIGVSSALLLVVAIFGMVKIHHWYQLHGGQTGYKKDSLNFNNSGVPAQVNLNSRAGNTGSLSASNNNNSHDNSSEDDSHHNVDPRSFFSCWKHWDAQQSAVSEESDSGWGSGSGSGCSVPEGHGGGGEDGDGMSLGGLSQLTRHTNFYNQNDDVSIWSVTADHPLRLSSGNSINGGSVVGEADDDGRSVYSIECENSIIVIATKDNQTTVRKT